MIKRKVMIMIDFNERFKSKISQLKEWLLQLTVVIYHAGQ